MLKFTIAEGRDTTGLEPDAADSGHILLDTAVDSVAPELGGVAEAAPSAFNSVGAVTFNAMGPDLSASAKLSAAATMPAGPDSDAFAATGMSAGAVTARSSLAATVVSAVSAPSESLAAEAGIAPAMVVPVNPASSAGDAVSYTVSGTGADASISVDIHNYHDLITAITAVDKGTYVDGSGHTINNVTLNFVNPIESYNAFDLPVLNNPNVNLVINGNGLALDGHSETSGLRILSGNVTLENVGFINTVAFGGDGGSGLAGGGGGAGLGGGLYVGANAHVTLQSVNFTGDTAVGGHGGLADPTAIGGGGGGGLGGNGGRAGYTVFGRPAVNGGGGGGGVGRQAAAGGFAGLGVDGTVVGGAAAGHGSGQRQDTVEDFSFAGWDLSSLAYTVISGYHPGGMMGGSATSGGSVLSGGGGGGVGGQSSRPYYNPEDAHIEAFPYSGIITPIATALLGFIVPEFGFATALAQLAADLKYDADHGDWSPTAIAGIASDVIAVGFSAKDAYRAGKAAAFAELYPLAKASKIGFAQRIFFAFGKKVTTFGPSVITNQVVNDDPEMRNILDSVYLAIRHSHVTHVADLPGQHNHQTVRWTDPDAKGVPTEGGDGGWGGGGGGGGAGGGHGGYGGGGGGGGAPTADYDFYGGDGGFGGGGGGGGIGAEGGAGGFGAGDGTDGGQYDPDTEVVTPYVSSGGGGAGLGGAVFVEEGGQLTINSGTIFTNNYAQGGVAVSPGKGYGNNMFLAGDQTLTLGTVRYQVISFDGGISDMHGSDSRYTGRASLVLHGDGEVQLGGVNALSGTIFIGDAALGAANHTSQAPAVHSQHTAFFYYGNGNLNLQAGGSFNSEMTIKAYAGGGLTVGDGVKWGGTLDLSALASDDPFVLGLGLDVPDFNIVHFPGDTGSMLDMFTRPYDGDHYRVMRVDGNIRLVSLTSNGEALAQWASLLENQGDPGTLLTLLADSNSFSLHDSDDLTVVLHYLAGGRVRDGQVTVDGSGYSGTYILSDHDRGAETISFTGDSFTGTLVFDVNGTNHGEVKLAQSVFVNDAAHRYTFGGHIQDFAASGLTTIDLTGLAYNAGSTWTLTGSTLTVSNGADTDVLDLTGSHPAHILLDDDGHGGTRIYASVYDRFLDQGVDHLKVDNGSDLASVLSLIHNYDVGLVKHSHVDLAGGGTGFDQDFALNEDLGSLTVAVHTPDISGTIAFQDYYGAVCTLEIDQAAMQQTGDTTYVFAPTIQDFKAGAYAIVDGVAVIDLPGMRFNADHSQMSWTISGSTLTVGNGTISDSFTLSGRVPTGVVLMGDGHGGTAVYDSLATAIAAANATQATGGQTLDLTLLMNGTMSSAGLGAIALQSGVTLTIDGRGGTLDGSGGNPGLFVWSGNVMIENLTIANTTTRGGDGSYSLQGGGGGGAGLGGGLFVAAGGIVTIQDVNFVNTAAVGGNGGAGSVNQGWNPGGNNNGGGGGGLRTSGGDGAASYYPGQGPDGVPQPFGTGGIGYNYSLSAHAATNGGFGGGGGSDTNQGANGGFGGGGGGSQYPQTNQNGGNIDGNPGTGGFGGGDAYAGGGGGLGAGGDIFVVEGGTLIVKGNSALGTGTVTGGAAGYGSTFLEDSSGDAGQAFGSGLFIQGNQTVTFDPGRGNTLTINGVIADEHGSIASATGHARIAVASGHVVLDPRVGGAATANTFSGGIALNGGNLELASGASAGSAGIVFGNDMTVTRVLTLDAGARPANGGTLANSLTGFNDGQDVIDLAGLAYVGGATAVVTGSTLRATDGAYVLNFALTDVPLTNFFVYSDGHGGTAISAGKPEVYTPQENNLAVATLTTALSGYVVYTIVGGDDAAAFALNALSGALTFGATPDYERPTDFGADHVYNLVVQVYNSTRVEYHAIQVNLGNANEAPVITRAAGVSDPASLSVLENTTYVSTVIASDVDDATTFAFSISGGADAAKFSIDGATGVLSFVAAPDFEHPADQDGDNVYEVKVRAGDGSLSDDETLLVTVVDAPESINLTGSAGADTLTGGSFHDILVGGNGNDKLYGLAGNDQLNGGLGNDTLDGGADSDFAIYSDATFRVRVNLALTTAQVTGGAGTDLLVSIENVLGSIYDDVLAGNGVANTLVGGAGNDSLDGGGGDDSLTGNMGNDTFVVDSLGDVVIEAAGEGTDTIQTTLSAYTLVSNVEFLTYVGTGNFTGTGNSADNWLYGGAGNDWLDGGQGVDKMYGGAGDDTYIIERTTDRAYEYLTAGVDTGGHDQVRSSVTFTLSAFIEDLVLTDAGNINGTGNELNNILVGNGGNNSLTGGAGNDDLNGGAGNDKMYGGTGDDTCYVDSAGDLVIENAGEGHDRVVATISYTLGANIEDLSLATNADVNGYGNDLDNVLDAADGNNRLYGYGGNDLLEAGLGNDSLYGGVGNDTYYVETTGDQVYENAGEGNDVVHSLNSDYNLSDNVEDLYLDGTSVRGVGNGLANHITGDDAGNYLDGGAGIDTLSGGVGDDTYVLDTASDVISEGAGAGTDTVQAGFTYTLAANFENLTLTGAAAVNGNGNSGSNALTGNDGYNKLYGQAGNDVLDGGLGMDSMYGGVGDDSYHVDTTGDRTYEVVLGVDSGGHDTVFASVKITLMAGIEDLVVIGTASTGGVGNELNNRLTGNAADNSLYGMDGNDVIDGGGSGDRMNGGLGDDTYLVDSTTDRTTENAGEGRDLVISSVTWTLAANTEDLVLGGSASIKGVGNALGNVMTGNGAINKLYGLDGNDVLDGGLGADSLYGGLGDDTFYIDNAADRIYENAGEGRDTVVSAFSYTLDNVLENLSLSGSAGSNGTGNGLDNVITGNGGDNLLSGLAGADILIGGNGNDNLSGGDGADRFVFGKPGVETGSDHISDFVSGVDFLAFTAADFGFAPGHVLTSAELSLTGTPTGHGGQFVYFSSTRALYWDANGADAGGKTLIVTFTNGATPHAGDFIFS